MCVVQKEVNVSELQLFEGISSKLQSVEAIVDVISLLDGSKICVGNSDERFQHSYPAQGKICRQKW